MFFYYIYEFFCFFFSFLNFYLNLVCIKFFFSNPKNFFRITIYQNVCNCITNIIVILQYSYIRSIFLELDLKHLLNP